MSQRKAFTHHLLESVDNETDLRLIAYGDEIRAGRDLWSRAFYWREVRGFSEQRVNDQEYRYFDGRGHLRATLVIENQNAPAPARAGASSRQQTHRRSIQV